MTVQTLEARLATALGQIFDATLHSVECAANRGQPCDCDREARAAQRQATAVLEAVVGVWDMATDDIDFVEMVERAAAPESERDK